MDPYTLFGAILVFVLTASLIVSAFRRSGSSLNAGVIIGKAIVGFLEDRYPSFRTMEQPERSSDPYLDTWLVPEEERRTRTIKGMIMGASVLLTWFVVFGVLLVLFTGEIWLIPALLIALLIIIASLVIAAVRMLRDPTEHEESSSSVRARVRTDR